MKTITTAAAALFAMLCLTVGTRVAAAAETAANDCLVAIQNAASETLTADVTCNDGDPNCDSDGAADGVCTISIRGAVNVPDPACTPRPIKKVKFKAPHSRDKVVVTPIGGSASSAYGSFVGFHVPLKKRGTRPGTRMLIASATADVKPRGQNKDKDKIKFTCNPCAGDVCGGNRCPTTCTNTAGGPTRLVLTIADSGTDLDNGWSGNSHNFPLVPNGKIDVCLSECDSSTDTECTACGATGPGTGSGVQFGAPLPLFASNVPVCVVSRWREDIRGTVNEATGATSLDIHLFSDVYLTDRNSVCPQCKNGRCNSGANANQACTVEATIPVFVSSQQTDNYELSATCVPSSPTATLAIDFVPLTSGTAVPLTGPTPCTAQAGEPRGVPVQPDSCGGSGCGAPCTGLACVAQVPDPTNPGSMICIDSKGGLSQLCCNNNPQRPCFTLANGGQVTRTGNVSAPQPPLPDLTYPKTNGGILAATFCIPATGTNTIDSVTGLPGPGAILLNGTGAWTK